MICQIPESTHDENSEENNLSDEILSDSLVSFLREMRYRPDKRIVTTRRKVNIAAGKSVSLMDISNPTKDSSEDTDTGSATDTESEMSRSETIHQPNDFDNDIEMSGDRNASLSDHVENSSLVPKLGSISEGAWIVVSLSTTRNAQNTYIGQVQKVYGNYEFEVKFVVQYRNEPQQFVWPSIDDVSDIEFPEIKRVLNEPTLLRRGVMLFTEV